MNNTENNRTEKPFLSIIVLIYNVEPFLRQCLDSIVNQTFIDFEVILVDDGSPDGCPTICDEYAARDARVKVIHQPNGGIVKARKAGIAMARGVYLGAVDGDDWIEKDMYEHMCSAAQKTSADIVYCNAIGNFQRNRIHMEHIKIEPRLYQGEEYRNNILKDLTGTNLFTSERITNPIWIKIIRKELLAKAIMDMDDRCTFGEDAACSVLCAAWANSIFFVDKYLYHYRQRPASVTHSYDSELYARIICLRKYLMEMKKQCTACDMTEQFEIVFVRLLIMAIGSEYIHNTDTGNLNKWKNIHRILRRPEVRTALAYIPYKGLCYRQKLLLFLLRLGVPPFKSLVTRPNREIERKIVRSIDIN